MAGKPKKGFVLYYDYRDHLALLKDEERGRLLMALLDYGEYGTAPELDGAPLMAFSFIAGQMKRDAEKYADTCRKRSEAGKQGGRPSKEEAEEKAKKAKGSEENQNNQSKAKKADTDTNKDTDTDTDIKNNIAPNGAKSPEPAPAPHKAIVELYHGICKSFPKLRSISDKRKTAISARWKEYNRELDTFRELFEKAEASDFLKGKNARNWAADFNWLLSSENMSKVLEGNYDNDKQKGGPGHGETRANTEQHAARPSARNEATLSGFRMADS